MNANVELAARLCCEFAQHRQIGDDVAAPVFGDDEDVERLQLARASYLARLELADEALASFREEQVCADC